MAVKKGKDLNETWGCECGKWNFSDAINCWKCHQPKYPNLSKKRVRFQKEVANVEIP